MKTNDNVRLLKDNVSVPLGYINHFVSYHTGSLFPVFLYLGLEKYILLIANLQT